MFLLHQRTRKSLCRLGFVLLCVAPTLGAALWAASRTSNAHHQACEAELAAALGLKVTADAVTRPRPRIVRYDNLRLVDPTTGEPVAAAASLELRHGDDQVLAIVNGAEVAAECTMLFYDAIHDWLRQRDDDDPAPFRVVLPELQLRSPAGTLTLEHVHGRLESTPTGRGILASFHVAGAPKEGDPAWLKLVRSQADGRAITGFELHTSGSSLPLDLVMRLIGAQSVEHTSGDFRGDITAIDSGDGWEGQLAGVVGTIDLESELVAHSAHRLGGFGEIRIDDARFRRGRLESAQGTFIVERGGYIGESLIAAASSTLGMPRKTPAGQPGDLVEYSRLVFDFAIDASGLTLRAPDASGVVLAGPSGPILLEPTGSSGPVVLLLRTLVPDSVVLVPATPQTESLMRFLPIPPVLPVRR